MSKAQAARTPEPANDAAEDGLPWAEAPAEARKLQLGKLFVPRAVEDRVVNIIEHARSDRLLYPEPQNVVISGETGVGKSEIAKRFLAANPERIDPETGDIIRPVLYVDVRNCSTPKSVAKATWRALMRRGGIEDENETEAAEAEAILDDSGIKDREKKDKFAFMGTPDLTYAIKKLMVGQRVEVAFLDEFHNTLIDNGVYRLNRVAEWVKDFAKSKERTSGRPHGTPEENIVIVLMGTRKVKNVVDPTVNAELASISPYRIEIDKYHYGTPEQKKEFRQFLDDLDVELPFDVDSALCEPAIADKLFLATFGLLRPLAQIVTKAAELAIDDGSDRIREHHLHDAVELKRGVLESWLVSEDSQGKERKAQQNPFTPKPVTSKPEPRTRRGYRGE